MAAGRSGLLHATTGSGKTYAVWMGALGRDVEVDRARPRLEGRVGVGEPKLRLRRPVD